MRWGRFFSSLVCMLFCMPSWSRLASLSLILGNFLLWIYWEYFLCCWSYSEDYLTMNFHKVLNNLNISFIIYCFTPLMHCPDLSLMSSSSDIVFSLVHYIGETFHGTLYLACDLFPFQYFSLIFLYYFYFFAEFLFNILFWLSYFIGLFFSVVYVLSGFIHVFVFLSEYTYNHSFAVFGILSNSLSLELLLWD